MFYRAKVLRVAFLAITAAPFFSGTIASTSSTDDAPIVENLSSLQHPFYDLDLSDKDITKEEFKKLMPVASWSAPD